MIAYFDCFSGISGDMFLGALVDAGVSVNKLQKELSSLKVKGYKLEVKKVKRAGLRSTKVDVVIKSSKSRTGRSGDIRTWKDIKGLIDRSSLSREIKQKGKSIFKKLFDAEACVHGRRYDRVHLHELGAIDCIVDIFGSIICLDILGISSVYSSPVNVGSGNVRTDHGLLPVPAPATVELLKGKPVYSSDIKYELTTPTGAALISSIASGFGSIPFMKISGTGIGAGNANFKSQPNVLRVLIGQKLTCTCDQNNGVTVIETNIDDMNPQIYEHVMDNLFKAGAIDVFLTQVIMKKGRPGIKLTVLCDDDKKEMLVDRILKETTSIGLRSYRADRKILKREIKSINTRYGKVRFKIAHLNEGHSRASIEYEDCRKIARKFNIPLVEVMKTLGN
jgi:uncharacterized protein (TIGR00299 family) protein